MADGDSSRESPTGETPPQVQDHSSPPDYLFRMAWEEINERMTRMRLDLEMSMHDGRGEETRRSLEKNLVDLQRTVDAFAERWVDFERKRKALEEKLNRS
ncbi:MAG TPA: hypothetical protein PLX54_04425 [Candidatus Fermentibacter daniensis]|nr:hypothetical protein [Candidatus Fermentibacter daniensis]HOR08006.1 hypothetical protein [Candidatus Fermentibacter daniensis]HPK51598.1 hypothetical protein [Candidatus Fermentibacter daniensis]